MRILFFADASDIHTKRWVSWYRDRGYRVDIISFLPAEIDGAAVHHIDAGTPHPYRINYKYILHLRKAARIRRRINADIVMAHYVASYGMLAALFCRRFFAVPMGTDIKVVPRKHFMLKWAVRFVLKRACFIFSTAQHITGDIIGMGVEAGKILTRQYGIDDRLFTAPEGQTRECVCISSRALKKNSNIDVILEGFSLAAVTHRELRLVVAGDGPEREYLRRKTAALNAAPAVEFTGMISETAMAGLLKKSLIFISLTSSDGAPLSLLEGMHAGALAVVSDIPANREWIRHGENGFLIPIDAAALARCIGTILALDETRRAEIRKAAAAAVRERGLFAVNMERMESIMISACRTGDGNGNN